MSDDAHLTGSAGAHGARDVPPLDPVVWPASTRRGADGAVHVGGVDLRAVAREHGTPVYVLDEDDFRARARAYRTAFAEAFARVGTSAEVYYAGKAFLSVAVARWAHEEGLRIDTATGGELAVALRAGVPGTHIGLHGNNKSDVELDRALAAGVGRIVVDSAEEVGRVVAAVHRARATGQDDAVAPVLVRVTTGVHAGGHEYISTAHEDQKFGLSIAGGRALAVLESVLQHPELELLGVHSHIGSQILETDGFDVAARAVLALRAELADRTGHVLGELDLGGGYGIAYLPGEQPIDVRAVADRLAGTVAQVCEEQGLPVPRISVEPGRAIAGPTTVTLYEVGTLKPVTVGTVGGVGAVGSTAGGTLVRTYVSVDGGMSDNLRPALYGAHYTAALVSRTSGAAGMLARVVGKHCESGDVVVHDVVLPEDLRRGDLLAVPATGAYGRSMASNYNMVPRPPVVAVRDGDTRVLVRRETEDDLLGLDLG